MHNSSSREKLLDAAMDTFARRGFNGSGVQDIVDHAGVPKGSFYNHFRSKEALGSAAVARYWEQRAAPLLAILADPAIPPVERVFRYLTSMRDRLAAKGFARGCMVGNLSGELSDGNPAIAMQLSAVLGAWTAAVEACITEAQAAGALRPALNAAATARFIVNSLQGAVLRTKVDHTGTALEDLLTVVRLVLAP